MPDYSEYADSSQPKSQFNSGVAQIYRMDNLKKDAHNHARKLNYQAWDEDIDRKWLELVADTDEKGDQIKKYNQFDKRLKKLSFFKTLLIPGFAKTPECIVKLRQLQKQVLIEKETFVHRIENKQGKGTAYEDSMDNYMD